MNRVSKWLLAVAGSFLGGCATFSDLATTADAKVSQLSHDADRQVPTLVYLRTELRRHGTADSPNYRFMDIIRLSNHSSRTFEFVGYSQTSMLWSRETWQNDEWVKKRRGAIDFTGLGPQRISPGDSFEFPAHSTRSVGKNEPGKLSRVGMELKELESGAKFPIWSQTFYPSTSEDDEALASTLGR